ncbi:G-type lectin S-receptor-like serine/threonine-protein kinase At4g27290 isoform X1 [Lactuca sativa]|uniref:Receptor-like serine/threonine-protein kinase n=1 Tax=Lactuca sativa TaxID=4236 RepID=A0A9R1VDE6_LACSA|nr:G-type lectin S-receptor-like serine/threonine-protein kinase At4g27290 isoform X1 [Lactuca sativa]KAJ0204133.1 hypothetical protein LSAT_V11C500246600 [Lactuca sativa]
MEKLTILFLYFTVLISIFITCASLDTISANQTITDGNTIVSAGQNFEMGFFSLGTSRKRYVGIWFKKISTRTVVWVANRETPLSDTSGLFKLRQGALQILSGNNSVIWSSNSTGSDTARDLVMQLLDTGNLILRDKENLIWQSFDYPGDTFLSGMRIGVDLITGKDRHLTSWKSNDDPSAGPYVFRVDPNGYPQFFVKRDVIPESRYGPWTGVTFNGMRNLGENAIFTHQFVVSENDIYYEYELLTKAFVSILRLTPDGKMGNWNWANRTENWSFYSGARIDDACTPYAICGSYGRCNINFDKNHNCSCLEGFEPRPSEERSLADQSSGCQRINPLACGNPDGFRKVSGVKFPDTNHSWYNLSMTLGECETACMRNCSCTAYANLDIRRGGSGCLQWFDDLMDIRESDETQELYIRIAASDISSPTTSEYGSRKNKQTSVVIVLSTLGLVVVCVIFALYVAWRKRKRPRKTILVSLQDHEDNYTNESLNSDKEMLPFSLSMIAKATNNFSPNNKLGEGGFGPVYKGVLEDGREIAVKRLSSTSKQGLDEFKNEVGCINKLQHRNLVKLLGYCILGDEKMLIYEYMANKSLDLFIFDESGSFMLDWPLCFGIINGIARGLLYLHQDSRLRIIHRDLKAANILLDNDMNPKISDFGLARWLSGYETEANTNKVVGTHGYISPEYALHGLFSVKSDVFSFGVLVLEIVSGKKNRGFSKQEHHDTLTGHAWRLHNEGRSIELVGSHLRHSFVDFQVVRVVHIGLLCVQHHADDRPTMSSVVLMLGNENSLPPPKQPAFFTKDKLLEFTPSSSLPTLDSVGELTITHLNAR